MIVKRLGPLSCGKMVGVVYATIGLIIGAIFALLSLVGAGIGAASSGDSGAWLGALFGVGAVIFLPLFYGVMGFICAILGAVIYNLAAKYVGGVEVEME